jgi:hypothetical protein
MPVEKMMNFKNFETNEKRHYFPIFPKKLASVFVEFSQKNSKIIGSENYSIASGGGHNILLFSSEFKCFFTKC